MWEGVKRFALPVVRYEPEEFVRHQSRTGTRSPDCLGSQMVVRGHWRSGFWPRRTLQLRHSSQTEFGRWANKELAKPVLATTCARAVPRRTGAQTHDPRDSSP